MPKSLTPRLQDLKVEIEGYARAFGLDFFETGLRGALAPTS